MDKTVFDLQADFNFKISKIRELQNQLHGSMGVVNRLKEQLPGDANYQDLEIALKEYTEIQVNLSHWYHELVNFVLQIADHVVISEFERLPVNAEDPFCPDLSDRGGYPDGT